MSVVVQIALTALPAQAAVGFEAHSFAGFGAESSGGSITGQKPESKLWYHAGSWWAAMLSPSASGAHRIWKLVGTTWTDTGVLIDGRASTKEDVLSLGNTLYILSRSPSTSPSSPHRLRRYTFNGSTYTLNGGFPVDVPGGGSETATLARDSLGTLWVTYTSGSTVRVVHTTGSDTSWGSPIVPNVGSVTSVSADDISSIIAFTDSTGPAVGVLWSNQNTQTDYFAVHRDGQPDTSWTLETALAEAKGADDHINLKTFEGRVYAAVKTSATKSSSPIIRLLVRSTSGSWSKHPVALVRDGNTRPITMLELDGTNRRIYVFYTQGEGTAARGIRYESSPMDGSIAFGSVVNFIEGDNSEPINDATSMKANADGASGIVVMASDGTRYWWNKLGGTGTPNTLPTATAGSATTSEDTSTTVTLSGSDPETCELTFSIVTQPAHGSLGSLSNQSCVAGNPNTDTAQVTYTPDTNYSGPDSFTFRVNDGMGDSSPATETVTIAPVNDAPAANAGSATTPQDTAVTVALSGSDIETCDLTFAVVSGPTNGTLGAVSNQACSGAGPFTDSAQILYTPAAGYTGPDSFTYKVTDGGSLDSAAATVSVTVSPPANTPPTAAAGSASTNEDTATTVTLSGSDTGTCELTFSIVTGPANGSLGSISNQACVPGSPNSDSATVQYTPDTNYSGPDSFTFKVNDGTQDSATATVSLTVNAVNDDPVANAQSTGTEQDTPVLITVTGSDVETCQLSFSIVSQPTNGTLGSVQDRPCSSGSPNTDSARVTYTPNAGYSGPDSFTFIVNDGTMDSFVATVSITVTTGNQAPVANAGSASPNEDTAATVNLSGSDVETCELTFSIVSQPAHGSLGSISNQACVTGSPNTDAATVQYTPDTNYTGPDSFTFKVNDGIADSPAGTITVTVNAVNDGPVANAGSATTGQNTPVTVNLSGSDVETCNLTFSIVTGPTNGTLGSITNQNCAGSGPFTDTAQVQYTPNTNYNGPDSFTFKVNDGTTDSAAATITLTVSAVNQGPTANAGSATTNEDTATTVTLSGSDGESCNLTFSVVTGPAHGTLGSITNQNCTAGSPNTDTATVQYTPAANYNGPDSFTFKVNDGTLDSSAATINITVDAVNDLPAANAGSATTAQNTPVTVNLSGSDFETCNLTFSTVAAPAHGTLGSITNQNCAGAGPFTDTAQVQYTPTTGYSGPDSFTYRVNDGTTDSPAATISITVSATATQITFRSASQGANSGSATSLVLPVPAGVQTGDVMIANVAARGNPTFTAPAGWNLVRLDINGFNLRQAIYWKVATASEPASYTWTWSGNQAAAGGIVAYSGVSTTNPIDVHSGAFSSTTAASGTAPSITTTVNGAMIIAFFGAARTGPITPPAGMTERFDAAATGGTYPQATEGSDLLQATAGATGAKTATWSGTGHWIGQQVALRPSGA